MTKNEEIKKVIFGLQFLKEKLYNGIFSDRLDCIDYAISAIKELQMYKDNKLCLVPEDVYSRQCCELDAYEAIGTVEECREVMEKLTKAEKAFNAILSGNYNDECNFCVHNNNPMANCQCISGDGSWCTHNAKWNSKISDIDSLEAIDDGTRK